MIHSGIFYYSIKKLQITKLIIGKIKESSTYLIKAITIYEKEE
jgi:hypothetical protein